jgi:hypothetical protein
MRIIGIAEDVHDNRRPVRVEIASEHRIEERLIGTVIYNYKAPTHWSSGICTVAVEHDFDGNISVSLRWGSGGINNGFTDIEIANTMANAFTMASKRMQQIEGASK